jgi:hypothetical protein
MLLMRSGQASDEELLARSADEPNAFGEFYERFEASMLAFFFHATAASRRFRRAIRGIFRPRRARVGPQSRC